jgi:superoxide reductase
MSDRRVFLKSALALAAGLTLGAGRAEAASGPYPTGIVYTADDPGMWAAKAAIHVPIVTVDGDAVTLLTNHPMSEDHFIVRHTVVSAGGTVVGSQVFTPESKPQSTYIVKEKGEYYATSFCNLHDFWLTRFTV